MASMLQSGAAVWFGFFAPLDQLINFGVAVCDLALSSSSSSS